MRYAWEIERVQPRLGGSARLANGKHVGTPVRLIHRVHSVAFLARFPKGGCRCVYPHELKVEVSAR